MSRYYTIVLIFTSLILSSFAFSQYTSPESVTYDSVHNRYLVTNSGGVIKQRSATGVVTDFAPSGSGSHGIRIHNGTAYACVGNRIKGFALSNGAEVFNVQLTGASFLNGMGISAAGIAYISDFTGQKIYKLNLNTQAWWIYVASAGGQPNGVYVDSPRNRLLVCFWGNNAAIKSVNLADSTINTIINTGHNNCDGIYLDKYENVYVSAWGAAPGKILRYDINFNYPAIPITGLGNPADIFINKNADTLAIPNSGSNTVTFHNIGNISGITQLNGNIPEKFMLHQNYPNPFNPVTKIKFEIPAAQIGINSVLARIIIYNSIGEEISTLFEKQLAPGIYEVEFDGRALGSGIYFYILRAGSYLQTRKMMLIK